MLQHPLEGTGPEMFSIQWFVNCQSLLNIDFLKVHLIYTNVPQAQAHICYEPASHGLDDYNYYLYQNTKLSNAHDGLSRPEGRGCFAASMQPVVETGGGGGDPFNRSVRPPQPKAYVGTRLRD